MPELNPQSPYTLFLVLVLLLLGSTGGNHVDRHLDYMLNSLQAAKDSIAAVRQGFRTFHATLVPPAPSTAPASAPAPAPVVQTAPVSSPTPAGDGAQWPPAVAGS